MNNYNEGLFKWWTKTLINIQTNSSGSGSADTAQQCPLALEFAKTYVTKPQSFWENVLWTDETKVELLVKYIMAPFTEK